MRRPATILAVLALMFSAAHLPAQEVHEKFPVLLDAEIGAERFTSSSIHSVFPVGGGLEAGPVFAFGDEWRFRVRPQAGVTFFSNTIDEWVTEQLLVVKVGGQLSYDLFYAGQVTFFPYVGADFNWVSNFDAEEVGEGDDTSIEYSDSYLKGNGFSPEAGVRVQMRSWYVKAGYTFFSPRLKVRRDVIDDDLASGYLTPGSHRFNFNSFHIAVGVMLNL